MAIGSERSRRAPGKRIPAAALILLGLGIFSINNGITLLQSGDMAAYAAGKGKAKGKGRGVGNGNGIGNGVGNAIGNAGGIGNGGGPGNGAGVGNGNGNGGGNGNGNGKGLGLGKGNGNGLGLGRGGAGGVASDLGVGLGNGVGVGVGLDNGVSVGVGIRILDGGSPKSIGGGKGNGAARGNGLDLEQDALPLGSAFGSSSVEADQESLGSDWRTTLGFDDGFDPAQIGADLGTDDKALSELLGPIGNGNGNGGGNGKGRAIGKATAPGQAISAAAREGNGLALGQGNGNGLALGRDKDNVPGKARGVGVGLGVGVAAANSKVQEVGVGLDTAQEQREKNAEKTQDQPLPQKKGQRLANAAILKTERGTYAPQELLAVDLNEAELLHLQALGFEPAGRSDGARGITTLAVPPGLDAAEALALLKRELPDAALHLNRIYRLYRPSTRNKRRDGDTSDTKEKPCLGDRCYGRKIINWRNRFAACARNVSVGIIDTNFDPGHPTFRGRHIVHRQFIPLDRPPSSRGHGTGVLAILAGRSDSNTPGLIPEARFFIASVFFTDEVGDAITDTVSIIQALDWLSASSVRLINMSFSGPRDELVHARIKTLRQRGFAFTAAAGNNGPAAQPTYPAAYPEVVAVTAVAKDMRVYPSANRGRHIDLAAPGVRIWTALPGGKEGYRTGTSFAAPFATATLAIQQPDILQEPKDHLLGKLRTVGLGPPGPDPIYGRGLLQAPENCATRIDPVSRLTPVSSSTHR